MRSPGRRWLTPATPQALGALRVLTAAYTLEHLLRRRRMLRRVAASDPALFAPVGPARALAEPLSPATFRALLEVTQALNVAVLLGVRHRVTGPLHGASLLAVMSYRNSFSMIYHTDTVAVLHAIILGASPAADAFSVDAARRRPGRSRAAHQRYGWPIRLMRTVTVLTYALAGVAKVKGPLGWRWAGGEALRSQIAADALRKELMGGGCSPLAFRLYQDRAAVAALRVLAVSSLVVELGAPLALASPRAGRLWALNAWAMHWGIYAVMQIKFRHQLSGIAFAAFALDAGAPGRRGELEEGRAFALAFSAATVAAVAWPVRENWRAVPRDGFPLSSYPMFTAKRRRRVRETYLLGRTASGERRTLHYRLAGSGGLNLVRRQMRRMADAGRGEEVCRVAAANLVASGGRHADVVRVQLVTGRYRLEEYFGGQREPLAERVRAECTVPWPVTRGAPERVPS